MVEDRNLVTGQNPHSAAVLSLSRYRDMSTWLVRHGRRFEWWSVATIGRFPQGTVGAGWATAADGCHGAVPPIFLCA